MRQIMEICHQTEHEVAGVKAGGEDVELRLNY